MHLQQYLTAAQRAWLRLIPADEARHGEGVRCILNDAIANTTAIFDDQPRSRTDMRSWFAARAGAGCPVLVAIDSLDQVQAFVTWLPFRAMPGYRFCMEHSIYVAEGVRRQGLAASLLRCALQEAAQDGRHLMLGLLDAENEASIRLHESLGFERVGLVAQAGWKFGRWLDLAFYRRALTEAGSHSTGNCSPAGARL